MYHNYRTQTRVVIVSMQAVGYIDTTRDRSISCTLRLKSLSPMLTTQTYSQYFTQAYQHQNKRFYKNHGKSLEEDTRFLIKLAPVE